MQLKTQAGWPDSGCCRLTKLKDSGLTNGPEDSDSPAAKLQLGLFRELQTKDYL